MNAGKFLSNCSFLVHPNEGLARQIYVCGMAPQIPIPSIRLSSSIPITSGLAVKEFNSPSRSSMHLQSTPTNETTHRNSAGNQYSKWQQLFMYSNRFGSFIFFRENSNVRPHTIHSSTGQFLKLHPKSDLFCHEGLRSTNQTKQWKRYNQSDGIN